MCSGVFRCVQVSSGEFRVKAWCHSAPALFTPNPVDSHRWRRGEVPAREGILFIIINCVFTVREIVLQCLSQETKTLTTL